VTELAAEGPRGARAVAVAAGSERTEARSSRRRERAFFAAMAVALLAAVFLGFARTYFLAGVFGAPLPSPVIHVHGALFSSWILFFLAQTALVSAGRVDVHRRLGLFGFGLAGAMVVLGLLAGLDLLRRNVAVGGVEPKTFYAGTTIDMVIFSTLVTAAYRTRSRPATHKRLVLISTIMLLGAAVARWPLEVIATHPWTAEAFHYSFLLPLIAYDLWSLGRIHRATLLGGVFMIVAIRLELPIGRTAGWQVFATWAQDAARSLFGGP
jgi:hypothetical protein